jgi:hypothetical protein
MPVSPPAAYLAAFREGLRERGYVEGQNLSIDVRWPPGSFEQNSGGSAVASRHLWSDASSSPGFIEFARYGTTAA